MASPSRQKRKETRNRTPKTLIHMGSKTKKERVGKPPKVQKVEGRKENLKSK